MLQQIEQTGFDHIAGLRKVIHQLWVKQCEHDGIDPTSLVAVFSEGNPFTIFANNAQKEYQEAMAAHHPGGGYVGLQIQAGKATFPTKAKAARQTRKKSGG